MAIVSPLEKGRAAGKLFLEYLGQADLDAALRNCPEIASDVQLLQKELEGRGWKHHYVEHLVKVSGEIELGDVEYQLVPWSIFKGNYSLMIDIGTTFPVIKDVRLQKLMLGIKTRHATHDLVVIDAVNKEILHITNIFWDWEDSWENDQAKLSEATDTYWIINWLTEHKGFKLTPEYNVERYQKISEALQKIISKNQQIIEQLENLEPK